MSSSEEEDCYGNIAQKLQSLKNNYRPDKLGSRVDGLTKDISINFEERHAYPSKEDSIINLLEDVPEIPDPPAVIPTKKPVARRSTRKSGSKDLPQNTQLLVTSKRGRKRKINLAAASIDVSEAGSSSAVPETANADLGNVRCRTSTPKRGRARGRRGRRAGSSRTGIRECLMDSIIYSIGNTLEYPDTAENIPIFSKKVEAERINAVEPIDISSSFNEEDENEEFSVKVCWQQTEYIKFNIRKFQKLTQMFEFFSKRDSVPLDKLLFTLKGKILRPDDTPDSIQYNIAHFIDGGVVNSSIAGLASSSDKENANTTGILIKFQCQNSKKPFETHVEADEKLSLAMIKCAEHLELPLSRLRFVLDGDAVSAASTPQQHGLDHGDCIDVKVTA